MFEAVFIAKTGITSQQQRIDTIADNIANVNTAGYKSSRLNFQDALFEAGGYPYADETLNTQKGHGALPLSVSRSFAAGPLVESGRELDFALEGDGFFEVENDAGENFFTKNGQFFLTPGDDEQFLVNSNGHFILDKDGERIAFPADTQDISIGSKGQILYTTPEISFADAEEIEISIRTFTNPGGLEALGNSYFGATVASGESIEAENYALRQGVLESSNVNLSVEFTNMIRAQRAFSLASRALTTADEMEGIANNMRR